MLGRGTIPETDIYSTACAIQNLWLAARAEGLGIGWVSFYRPADLSAHAGATQRFMPGIGLRRKGDVRQCQGTVLADWIAAGSDGKERMSGTSVFAFSPDGRIDSVTGFTNPSPA